jgi:hypothetical protein
LFSLLVIVAAKNMWPEEHFLPLKDVAGIVAAKILFFREEKALKDEAARHAAIVPSM